MVKASIEDIEVDDEPNEAGSQKQSASENRRCKNMIGVR